MNYPNQRVSFAEKLKPEWYRAFTDYIIEVGKYNKDTKLIEKCINASNGIIDDEDLNKALASFQNIDSELNKVVELTKFRNVDFIVPIKEKMISEYIKLFHEFYIYLKDDSAILKRNNNLNKELKDLIVAAFMTKLQEEGVANTQPTKKVPDDFETFKKEFISDWIDNRVIAEQDALDLLRNLSDDELKYIHAFNHWWTTEEYYTYRSVNNDDVNIEVIHPLDAYRIPSGNIFVEDDVMFLRKGSISIYEVEDKFKEIIDNKDMLFIKSILSNMNDNRSVSVNFIQNLRQLSDIDKNFTGDYVVCDKTGKIDYWHCVAKTQTKVNILNYIGDDGELYKTEVDFNYVIDPSIGDIDTEIVWREEVIETYKFFNDSIVAVYSKPRVLNMQRRGIDGSVKLPYNGITGLFNNKFRNPIPYRLIPYEALYKIYTREEEKAIAKFKPSMITIPESLLKTGDLTMYQRLGYLKRDDVLILNDDDPQIYNKSQLLRGINLSSGEYIRTLMELRQSIKAEAWEVAHMNDQRAGNISPYAGKGTTEYAISSAALGSLLMITIFNKCREKDYEANLDYTRFAWSDVKSGAIRNPDGTIKFVNINKIDRSNNIGIFAKNTQTTDEELKALKEYAFAASQNGSDDLAMEAISSDNPAAIRKKIKDVVKARQELEQQIRLAESENNMKAEQYKNETVAKQLELEKLKLSVTSDTTLEAENIKADAAIEVAKINSINKSNK